jgi:hypothetical protein
MKNPGRDKRAFPRAQRAALFGDGQQKGSLEDDPALVKGVNMARVFQARFQGHDRQEKLLAELNGAFDPGPEILQGHPGKI